MRDRKQVPVRSMSGHEGRTMAFFFRRSKVRKAIPDAFSYLADVAELFEKTGAWRRYVDEPEVLAGFKVTATPQELSVLASACDEVVRRADNDRLIAWIESQDEKDSNSREEYAASTVQAFLWNAEALGFVGVEPFYSARLTFFKCEHPRIYDPDQKPGETASHRPFVALQSPRDVGDKSLPQELADFYTHNEGIGLESCGRRYVRLCQLAEIERHKWHDVHLKENDDSPGWVDGFEGILIGYGQFWDGIYLVQNAPSCPKGSILAIGVDIAGPSGTGPHEMEPSLVLAPNLEEWLRNLERNHWFEYGLGPGAILDRVSDEQSRLRRYYKALNPRIDWHSSPESHREEDAG